MQHAAVLKPVNPAEAFTAGDRVVGRRSLRLGTVKGDTSGAWNEVFVRWDDGDAGMVHAHAILLADGYVVSVHRGPRDLHPTPATCADIVCTEDRAEPMSAAPSDAQCDELRADLDALIAKATAERGLIAAAHDRGAVLADELGPDPFAAGRRLCAVVDGVRTFGAPMIPQPVQQPQARDTRPRPVTAAHQFDGRVPQHQRAALLALKTGQKLRHGAEGTVEVVRITREGAVVVRCADGMEGTVLPAALRALSSSTSPMVPQICQQPQADAGAAVVKAAHTPGPWHRNIKPASKYPTVWAGRNTHVAAISPGAPRRSGNGCTMSEEEQEANINLIAAAPCLLAALREMVEIFREGCADADEPSAVRDALTAIARAEGR